MKKTLKVLVCITVILLVTASAIYSYVFREQSINTKLIPNEFTYCGKKIGGKNPEYTKIVAWLKSNNNEWSASFITFEPKQVYWHSAFSVNVLESAVVVSYKTDYGYPQYIKLINHDFDLLCG